MQASLSQGAAPTDPRDLLESIAVANFGKFSIAGSTNRDYAGDHARLHCSLPYSAFVQTGPQAQ